MSKDTWWPLIYQQYIQSSHFILGSWSGEAYLVSHNKIFLGDDPSDMHCTVYTADRITRQRVYEKVAQIECIYSNFYRKKKNLLLFFKNLVTNLLHSKCQYIQEHRHIQIYQYLLLSPWYIPLRSYKLLIRKDLKGMLKQILLRTRLASVFTKSIISVI